MLYGQDDFHVAWIHPGHADVGILRLKHVASPGDGPAAIHERLAWLIVSDSDLASLVGDHGFLSIFSLLAPCLGQMRQGASRKGGSPHPIGGYSVYPIVVQVVVMAPVKMAQ